MKSFVKVILVALLLFSCTSTASIKKEVKSEINFTLDLSKPADDLFHVTVNVSGLTAKNNIYHFAAVVPGTYRYLNFGRFVESFKAYDASGKEVKSEKISTNQYKLSEPSKVAKVVYDIEDSYDSARDKNGIFPMGGTEIDSDHAIINTFGVFGYFHGLQSNPIQLKLKLPEMWMEGTALPKVGDSYHAETYDHLADSPIMVGKLTKGTMNAGGIDVDVYAYSTNGILQADSLIKINAQVLRDAEKFISYPIVKRYVFLMSFLDRATIQRNNFRGFGALEHSYSSLYVLPEFAQMYGRVADISAHEFFHVMTPLNIHSEVIESYNFTKPRPSRHLWLYEGTTEWASDIMQFRNGSIDLNAYLNKLSAKITRDKKSYDKNYSLEKLSLTSYDSLGGIQYGNIYERGAYVAGLLDIKLLKLSNGKRGLREVIIDLSKKFGKSRAFDDAKFYDIFVKETYPEIRDFIENYIRGTKDYPIEEYFSWLGIQYIDKVEKAAMGIGFALGANNRLRIRSLTPEQREKDVLETGDTLLEIDGNDITTANQASVFAKFDLSKRKVGDTIKLKISRDGEVKTLEAELVRAFDENVLKVMDKPSAEQLALRKAWMVNLAIN